MNLRLSMGAACAVVGALVAAQSCSSNCMNCPGAPDSLVISPRTPSVLPAHQVQLLAEVLDSKGRLLAGKRVHWQSLDPSLATVGDTSGLASGLAVGNARIVATFQGLVDTAPLAVVTTSTFRKQVYPILKATCGIGGCHVSGGPKPTMNADTTVLYTALTRTDSGYVTAGDTTMGKLLARIRGDTTAVMPPQQKLSTLAPGNYDLIAYWIAQGALNN